MESPVRVIISREFRHSEFNNFKGDDWMRMPSSTKAGTDR